MCTYITCPLARILLLCALPSSTSEPCSVIRSAQKPVFHQYLPIRGSYSMRRCLELEIYDDDKQTDKTDCFTPCAWARGNNIRAKDTSLLDFSY